MIKRMVMILLWGLSIPAVAAESGVADVAPWVEAPDEPTVSLPTLPAIDSSVESAAPVTDSNALIRAIQQQNADALREAIRAGADVNRQTADGSYPIIVAAVHGTADIMKILTAYGADVRVRDAQDRSALHYAAMTGDMEKAKLMVAMRAPANLPDNDGITPLFYAYLNKHLDVADLLLSEAGASVNALDGNGTMLAVYALSEQPSVDVFQHMLDAGLNIFRRDASGYNLVEIAAKMEKEAVAELLQQAYDERLRQFQQQQQKQELPPE